MNVKTIHHRDTETQRESERDSLTETVIGAAIEVHRVLGPGLLESAYEECLCYELDCRKLNFRRQVALPVSYKAITLDCAYRMDVVVEDQLILELKAVDKLLPIHDGPIIDLPPTKRAKHGPADELQRPGSQRRPEKDEIMIFPFSGEATSHSTKTGKSASQVAGYGSLCLCGGGFSCY